MAANDPILAALRSPSLAEALFQEAGDALFVVDPATERVVEVNPLAQRLTGLGREALVGLGVATLLRHEGDRTDWLEAGQVTRTYHGRDGFLLATARTDVWLPVSLSVSRLHPPVGPTLALYTLRDRREQVEAVRRLERTEAELRRVLSSVSDCLWSCQLGTHPGVGWRYRYLSPVVQRLTGRSVGFFLEDPGAWERVLMPQDRERWEAFRAKISVGESAECEFRVVWPDGAVVWMRESVVAVPEDRGPAVLYGVLTDVTQRRRAEEASRELALAQARKTESLAQFAGSVAHDFNNLITGILGNTSLARLGCPPGSPVTASLGQIEAIASRAADLCKQLQLCAGRGPGDSAPRSLETLIRETVDLAREAFSPGVTLHIDLAPDSPDVRGDAGQLRQLVLNLLANASDALADGPGEVRLETRRASLGPADLVGSEFLPQLPPSGDYVRLTVSDTGRGIPPEILPRIFDPFFTSHPGASQGGGPQGPELGAYHPPSAPRPWGHRPPAWRGLGLATVLGIVRSHGGAIRVASRPGQGARFEVLLPAATRPPVPAHVPGASGDPVLRSPAPGGGGELGGGAAGGLILVIDDEEAVRDVAGRLLLAVGYRSELARDGAEGLRLLRQHGSAVRLVLLDLTMPRVSGEQVFRQLREESPDIRVVLMSGLPEAEAVARFHDQVLEGYLQKPFRLPTLLALLERSLGARPEPARW